MALRLTFGVESDKDGRWVGLEGEDAEAIFEAWNASGWWAVYPPGRFRQHLVDMYGLDLDLPVEDAVLLDAIVEKDQGRHGLGWEGLRLEGTGTGLAQP